ncbi:MAG: hypothetical protein U9N30_07135 [Campylobacterota bacterium]|nr:hypothetical protein [Campylobacterota bacterium]
MNNEIIFDINNLSYSFEVDSELRKELIKFLPTGQNLSTEDLLLAYVRKSNEFIAFKKQIEQISDKLPALK